MESDQTGVLTPAGLAFSPGAKVFHVVEARGQPTPVETEIIKLTPFSDRLGSARIAAAIQDPINMAFDGQRTRLLIVQSPANNLIEVLEDPDGNLDPATLIHHDARQFGLQNPQGLTVDPVNGQLFILDAVGPRLVRIEPEPDGSFENAVITGVDLQPTGLTHVRGLAFDPTSGHLHLLSPAEQRLYELTQTGQLVARRDLAEFDLGDPQGLVFAPSGDQTDDPLEMSLYIAASGLAAAPVRIYLPLIRGGSGADEGHAPGDGLPVSQSAGKIVELSFTEPPALVLAASTFQSALIQTIDTWQWSPPSPDPAGIVYLPAFNNLLISDSEVDEMPIFSGENLFQATLTGILTDTLTTVSFTDEPSGVTLNPANGHLFFSDDTGHKWVFERNPGADGLYDTPDDIITSLVTADFGSNDPEGVTFASPLGALFIADGLNREVYRVTPGANGIFDGVPPAGDDQVTSFDTLVLGLEDPEGIAYNPASGNLYVVGKPAGILFEVTIDGFLIQTIDISAANAQKPAGLAYAPSSQNPAARNIYIVDRGADNDIDPNENDGKLYEMTLPLPPGGPVAPLATDDNTIIFEGTPVTIDVAANDSDLNGNLDPASANTNCANGSSGCADPTNGTLANHGHGTFTYTPNPGYTGLDSFVYEICDADTLCDIATVTISVFGQQILYVSSSSGGNAGGVTFEDEDILAYDLSTGTWSMYFDGSDVGLDTTGQDINAFHVNADGSILLSLVAAGTLPNVGSIDDSDIMRFLPTSIGANTAGTYEWYFDGSDVDLLDTGEDIDAVGFTPDGRLIISTANTFSVSGVSGADEDLLSFTATSLGETTSGSWALYFDGSDVGLNSSSDEDINGTWLNDNGDIYLTTLGEFSVSGAAGDGVDIFRCDPGSTGDDTSCTFNRSWDGSAYGFGGERLDGFAFGALVVLPPVAGFTGSPPSGEAPLAVSFSDQSTNNPTARSWSFGDGASLNGQNPTHTYADPGVYTVILTASNAAGSDTITKTNYITVRVANDPPLASDDRASTPEDRPVTIHVAANDSDPDGNLDPASANTACANGSGGCADPTNGSLANNGDGSLTYTSNPGFTGDDSFVYEICDTDLLCDTATVTVTVSASEQNTIYVPLVVG